MTRRAGVYGMPFDQVGGGQLHQALVADVLTARYQVDLIHHAPGLSHEQLARDYGVNLDWVRLREVAQLPARWPYVDAGSRTIRGRFDTHRRLTAEYDLFVNVVLGPPIRSYARRGVLLVLFPSADRRDIWPWCESPGTTPAIKRVLRNAYYDRRWRRVFASYQGCVANSSFTAGWIKTRWGLDSEVVYPPVRARFKVRPKEKLILSVGRFSRYGTQKKQLEMVQSFAGMGNRLLGGWEYLCMGGVTTDPADRRYYQEVCEAARGHRVQVIANPSGQAVEDAYERAAVFWHAAGYGEDELAHPERTEHFGMSTVEAMAAGCIPVVIRKGGQPEIVEHGSSGFLWDTLNELVEYTDRLAGTPELREDMARAARTQASRFTDPDAFAARLLAVLDPQNPAA